MFTSDLSKLDIRGQTDFLEREPGFDFYWINKVISLSIDFMEDHESTLPSLTLIVEYERNSQKNLATLLFGGVRELILPPMNPWLFLPELEVEDVRERMMEGINFEAVSQFEGAFRCVCRDIAILGFQAT